MNPVVLQVLWCRAMEVQNNHLDTLVVKDLKETDLMYIPQLNKNLLQPNPT